VSTNFRGAVTAQATVASTANMLLHFEEIIVKAARTAGPGIVDVESNEIWQEVKMHGISLERYIGRNTGGGLEKLRREVQAENEGIVIV